MYIQANIKMTNIEFIADLYKRGLAYECDSYIVFDSSRLVLSGINPPFVQYPILFGKMKNKTDFPLWAPYPEGTETLWGRGNLTANTEYLKMFI